MPGDTCHLLQGGGGGAQGVQQVVDTATEWISLIEWQKDVGVVVWTECPLQALGPFLTLTLRYKVTYSLALRPVKRVPASYDSEPVLTAFMRLLRGAEDENR